MRLILALRLILVLAVALTSVQTALGRAEARGAEAILICAAGGTEIVTLDAGGKPVTHRHTCPDCVLGGLALAPAPVLPVLQPRRLVARLLRPRPARRAQGRQRLAQRARGPPAAA
jgi:hypothetical protein